MQVHITKARVIDGQSDHNDQVVDITVTDGKISSISAAGRKSSKATLSTIAVDGKEIWKGAPGQEVLVSNGWVDVFADYREPGLEHKEMIETGLAAAASGGFTDVLVMPNTQPSISSKSVIQYVTSKAAGNVVSLHALGTVTANAEGKDIAEMMDMYANGGLAFTDGWKPVQNPQLMLKALEYVKAFSGTVLQMPVDAQLSAGGLMNESIVSTALGLQGIPTISESLMVYRDIELLRYTNSRLHITGVSTAESLALIRKAKKEKLSITCSVTPYHLALNENELKGYSSHYKVMPPLRGEADRQALIKGLADGTIDCIATHHRPHEWDAKTKELDYAADGMAIQELAFNIVWNAVKDKVTIERLVAALTPRSIFDMSERTIKKGAIASLTVFSTTGTHTLENAAKKSMAINNPFIGQELAGRVIAICNNGTLSINN